MRRRVGWGLAALLIGVGLVGGGILWHRLHLGGPRTAWRRLVRGDPTGIVIHHSATPGIIHGQYVGAAFIDRSHQRRGFAIRYRGKLYHIGYHYVIREDGVIEAGRPEHCMGAHSKTHNDYLGICMVGNFSTEGNPHFWTPSRPTPEQLQSLVWLCRRLMAKYDIPLDRVVRHCDVRDTECPGDRFPFAWLRQQISQPSRTELTTETQRSGNNSEKWVRWTGSQRDGMPVSCYSIDCLIRLILFVVSAPVEFPSNLCVSVSLW